MTIKLFAKTHAGWWAKSPIELFTFPGGEPHARDNGTLPRVVAQLAVVTRPTMEDLFSLVAWANLVKQRDEQIWVAMPYMPFARADREEPFMARDFVSFVKNLIWPHRFLVLDPHSQVIVDQFHHASFRELNVPQLIVDATNGYDFDGIIAPDKGAVGRATDAAIGMDLPLYRAGKTRDFETGKLTGFHMEDDLPHNGNFLIVDDICDGGGTFIGLAEAIKKKNPGAGLSLWVSHGIFSKGVEILLPHFDHIFTSNSFTDGRFLGDRVHVTDLLPSIYKEISK